MDCPNCGSHNDDTYRFCLKCGTALPAGNTDQETTTSTTQAPSLDAETPPPQSPIPETPAEPATPTSPAEPTLVSSPSRSPSAGSPPPGGPSKPRATSGSLPTFESKPRSPQTDWPERPRRASQGPSPTHLQPVGRSGISALNIWGPFAGYGTRRRHLGWLMDGKGSHAPQLIESVETRLMDRKIPQTSLNKETLVAQGLLVENRPYFIMRRGLVSMGLYITEFGKDLFISIASYLKPPISNFRVLVLAVMTLFGLYMIFGYPSGLGRASDRFLAGLGSGIFGGSASGESNLFFLLCVIGPLGLLNNLALLLFGVYGAYKWLTERDFWAGLRVPPNEFNEDDLMALEKAVEQTVRVSLDEIGLDPDDLIPTSSVDPQRLI